MLKRLIAILGVTAAISACAVATPVITPSGQQGFTINCSIQNDIGKCYQKAGELCGGNGYEVLDQKSQSSTFMTVGSQTMLVRCKSAGEKQ